MVALPHGDPTTKSSVAWWCHQQLHGDHQANGIAEDKALAETILETSHTCSIPKFALLGGPCGAEEQFPGDARR